MRKGAIHLKNLLCVVVCSFLGFTQTVFADTTDQTLYVSNYIDNTISVIDPADNSTTATVTVGTNPTGIAVLPDLSFVYVVNAGDNTVSVIDADSNIVTTTITNTDGLSPRDIIASSDGSKVYVSNEGNGSVSAITTSSNTVTANITVGFIPRGLAISPDGSTVYVANYGDDTVSLIDTDTDTVSDTITLPGASGPTALTLNTDGSILYVANNSSNTVSVIDTSDNSIVASMGVDLEPLDIQYAPNDDLLYVIDSFANMIDVLNAADNTNVSAFAAGNIPNQAVLSADDSLLYVAEQGDNVVTVYNTSDFSTAATIAVGQAPTHLTMARNVSEADLSVTVALVGSSTIINGSEFTVLATITNNAAEDATNVNITANLGNLFIKRNSKITEVSSTGTKLGTYDYTSADSTFAQFEFPIGTIVTGQTRYFQLTLHNDSSDMGYSGFPSSRRYTVAFTIVSGSYSVASNNLSVKVSTDSFAAAACDLNQNKNDTQNHDGVSLIIFAMFFLSLTFLRTKMKKHILFFILVFGLLWNNSSQAATSQFSFSPDLSVLGSKGLINTLGATGTGFKYHFSADTTYERGLFKTVLRPKGIVKDLLIHNFDFSYSPSSKVQLDLIVPIISYERAAITGLSYVNKASFGDVALRAHYYFWNNKKNALALVPYLTLPTGQEEDFTADNSPRGGLILAGDWQMSPRWYAALNLGAETNQTISTLNYSRKGRLLLSGGLAYKACETVTIKSDLVTSTAIDNPWQERVTSPVEIMGGLDMHLKDQALSFNVSGGGPVVRSATTPLFTIQAGLTYAFDHSKNGPTSTERKTLQPTLYFDKGSSKISKTDQEKLDEVAKLLKKYPNLHLLLAEGHTDSSGTHKNNKTLSVKRATAAKKYLVEQKISSARIRVVGLAESKPTGSNNTVKGQAQNRRVELRLE